MKLLVTMTLLLSSSLSFANYWDQVDRQAPSEPQEISNMNKGDMTLETSKSLKIEEGIQSVQLKNGLFAGQDSSSCKVMRAQEGSSQVGIRTGKLRIADVKRRFSGDCGLGFNGGSHYDCNNQRTTYYISFIENKDILLACTSKKVSSGRSYLSLESVNNILKKSGATIY